MDRVRFGLNDAIEAGLVKTPRIVIRDDALANAKTYASKLYHLYREDEVRDDLNRKAERVEPLPDIVQKAYAILAYDWRETASMCREEGHVIPPVMLTVCNRTETAARIEHFFNSGGCVIDATQAPERTLCVDSRVLEKAERGETVSKDKDYAERLSALIAASGLASDKQADLLGLKQEEQLRALVDSVKRGRPASACRTSSRPRCCRKVGMTTRPCQSISRSQISHAVHDITWEKAVVDLF